jgi:hypothetical protein
MALNCRLPRWLPFLGGLHYYEERRRENKYTETQTLSELFKLRMADRATACKPIISIIRRLTFSSSPNIKQVVGTVSGLDVGPDGYATRNSVSVRKSDDTTDTVSADLVVGKSFR